MNMKGKALIILLVEDNRDHAELVVRSLENHRVANEIHHVIDGQAALDYLYHKGEYSDEQASPVPHLILLDLRLPRMDGLEVLNRLKSDQTPHKIPVVVLTSSEAENDRVKAYSDHANSYLVKPLDFAKFSQLMDDLGYYWLAWNRPPYNGYEAG
jgi:CheY-like chemotaxis protein